MFLVLIEKFDWKLTFSTDWHELGLKEPNNAQTERKRDFQESDIVLHSFNV